MNMSASCGKATIKSCVFVMRYRYVEQSRWSLCWFCFFFSLKVFGELPTLSVGLTDDCVAEMLQVLVSIPLPEGYSAATDEDVDEFAESVCTRCCLFSWRLGYRVQQLRKPVSELQSIIILSYGITMSYLFRWTYLALNPARQSATRFTYPGYRVDWLYTEIVFRNSRPGQISVLTWPSVQQLCWLDTACCEFFDICM